MKTSICLLPILVCLCLLGCRRNPVDPVNLHGKIKVRSALSAVADDSGALLWPQEKIPSYWDRPKLVLQAGTELLVDRVEIADNDFEEAGVHVFVTVLTGQYKETKLSILFSTGLIIDEEAKGGKPARPRFNPVYFDVLDERAGDSQGVIH